MMSTSSGDLHPARPREKAAALFVPCLASLSIFAMPFIFSAMIQAHSLSLQRATIATSAEISMIALGSIFVSMALKTLSPCKTSFFSVIAICLGQLATIHIDGFLALVLSRGLVGLGEGLCMGIGFSCLAQMAGGTRLISYCTGIVAALSLVSFVMIPELEPWLGSSSVFWVLLVFAVLCLPLTPFVPKFSIVDTGRGVDFAKAFSVQGLCLFLIGVLASCGSNTLWLYFEQIGTAAGLSPVEVGRLGSLSAIPTLFVSFIANFIFARSRSVIPLMVVCVISGSASYFYVTSTSSLWFALIVTLMTFLYIFLLAFIRMYSAFIDHTGRTTAAVGGADSVGMVVGPLLAAYTLNLTDNLHALGIFGLIMQISCILPCFIIVAIKLAGAKQQAVA